jgi:DNA polymerase III subunit chi
VTRIDFYLLPLSEPHGKLSFACKLVEKAWAGGHHIHVHGNDPVAAHALDELLWSFRGTSFIPHQLRDASAAVHERVTIGCSDDPGEQHDVLINLADSIPEFFSRFERVAEIVLNDEDSRSESRRRWSYYKDRGYALKHHDMQSLRSAGDRQDS